MLLTDVVVGSSCTRIGSTEVDEDEEEGFERAEVMCVNFSQMRCFMFMFKDALTHAIARIHLKY